MLAEQYHIDEVGGSQAGQPRWLVQTGAWGSLESNTGGRGSNCKYDLATWITRMSWRGLGLTGCQLLRSNSQQLICK